MTPAGLAARLRKLGVIIGVRKGLPVLSHPTADLRQLLAPIKADLDANRAAVLAEFGLDLTPCPLCCRDVLPRGGIPDCDRMPVEYVVLHGAGFRRVADPKCPYAGRMT